MPEADESVLLNQARDAAARNDWGTAYQRLVEADAEQLLRGAHLAFLADVAYAAGYVDVTIDAWERRHADAVQEGDDLGAAGAAVRVALHLLFDTALLAPIRGWAARAERLLGTRDETPVHAWLAVVRSYERLLSGDFPRAREWARRAIAAGVRHDPSAAAIGRVAEARSLILEGDVTRGLALLNEAAVATVSGELDPLSTGMVYCEIVCALQALAQYDRADEWTQAMERWRQGQPVGSIHGRCRVHRAEILRLRGSCAEAEEEALAACEELRPYLRREFGWPLTELGRIRLRRGDVAGAEEAFLAAHRAGWDPQPGLALVRLAVGDVRTAAEQIRDALEHPVTVPSKELPPNTDLRRAPLLEAQVEIAIAAGDTTLAQSAADELTQVAAAFQSRALAAGAALARGRVQLATGDLPGARRQFEAAAEQWSDIGAPFETALARVGLAQACLQEGNDARARLELGTAREMFAQIGAAADAARAGDALDQLQPDDIAESTPPAHAPAATVDGLDPDNVLRREGDYWLIVFERRAVRLRDASGMPYLVELLGHPGREFHVLDLVTAAQGEPARPAGAAASRVGLRDGGDAGELLDARARAAYRRRLADIDADLEEARARADAARIAQATSERDFLVRELSRAVGLGGRDRRAGAVSERARASVTQALRRVLGRIRRHHPALGEHLDRTIRTGTYCAYLPDSRVPTRWAC